MANNKLDLVLEKLRIDFVAELPASCAELEAAVLAQESGSSANVDQLFRQIHSLKGAAMSVKADLSATVCHAFEDFLSSVGSGAEKFSGDTALAYVDTLRNSAGLAVGDPLIMITLDQINTARRKSRTPTILLAETSKLSADLISKALLVLPARVVIASTGSAVSLLLEQKLFDLLVCAGELTDGKAVDLIGQLRKLPGINQKVPVIVIAAKETVLPAALGISAVLPRDPELMTALAAKVNQVLRR